MEIPYKNATKLVAGVIVSLGLAGCYGSYSGYHRESPSYHPQRLAPRPVYTPQRSHPTPPRVYSQRGRDDHIRGLPRHMTPENIQRNFRHDVEVLRRRQGRR